MTVAVSAGAVALAGIAGIASAATQHSTKAASSGATGTTGAQPRHNADEAELTGATLKSASDAAVAANPGATVDRASAEDPAEAGDAAYEVKITKADGSRAEVLENSAFEVLSTRADRGHGGRGDDRHGNPAEKELTGTTLTKAKAAAEAAVFGGTAERATAEDPAEGTGAAYEVHVEKADGSDVAVLLDSSFGVVKTVADTHHGPHGG